MFFAKNARARLAAAHHLVEILRDLPSFCFLFQSFSVDFNIDLTQIILHPHINHSQTDCCLYFLFIGLSIFSFYVQDDW